MFLFIFIFVFVICVSISVVVKLIFYFKDWVGLGHVFRLGPEVAGQGPWGPDKVGLGLKKTRLLYWLGSSNKGGPVGQVWASKNPTRTWPVAIPILKLQQKSKSQFTQTLPHILP